jgi:hypothetical protein
MQSCESNTLDTGVGAINGVGAEGAINGAGAEGAYVNTDENTGA